MDGREVLKICPCIHFEGYVFTSSNVLFFVFGRQSTFYCVTPWCLHLIQAIVMVARNTKSIIKLPFMEADMNTLLYLYTTIEPRELICLCGAIG